MRGLPERGAPLSAPAASALVPQLRGPPGDPRPDQTQRVACPLLRLPLDARRTGGPPACRACPWAGDPLGSKGTIDGRMDLIGFHGAQRHRRGHPLPWREYLIYEPRKGFRWLVESKGHWSFVEPVNAGT